MDKQFLPTGAAPRLMLEIHGDLRLKGWDALQVSAKADSAEDLTVEQSGDDLTIRCASNCSLKIPRQATVYAETLAGNTEIKGVDGVLILDKANGDLEIRSTGAVTINHLSGNLSVKNVFGKLSVGKVGGDATVRDVHGDFVVSDRIQGNLRLDDVDGNASAAAGGDAKIRIEPLPGKTYRFSTGGNLRMRVPPDISVALSIERAGHVGIQVAETRVNTVREFPFHLSLGDGDAEMTLEAGGEVLISTQAPDWELKDDFGVEFEASFKDMAESMGEQITQQIESQVRTLEEQIGAQLSNISLTLGVAGLSEEQRQRIEQRAREAGERAAARAQERLRASQERIESRLAAAQRRAESKARATEDRGASRSHRSGVNFSWPPRHAGHAPHPESPHAPVSDDERLVILRMLEEKQITLEQAEQLLTALEGKDA